jgi:hypothetical protein
MQFRHDSASSIWDRVGGALISIIFMGITVVFLPIVFGLIFRVRWLFWSNLIYTVPFFVWGAVVSFTAIFLGATLGSFRTVEFFAHMWGTETPENQRYTIYLRLGMLVSGAITYLLFYIWPRLFL